MPLVTAEVAKKFVITHLDSEDEAPGTSNDEKLTPSQRRTDMVELDECIEVLGGRLTDLEFFGRNESKYKTISKPAFTNSIM